MLSSSPTKLQLMASHNLFNFVLLAFTITIIRGGMHVNKIKRPASHGHELHKDHVMFLGEEAAREFTGLTEKESVRRLR